jgi:hypothetical protein
MSELIGRLNMFWYLLTFSITHNVASTMGITSMDITPNSFIGNSFNKANVGRKYHSGSISVGVANGDDASSKPNGS